MTEWLSCHSLLELPRAYPPSWGFWTGGRDYMQPVSQWTWQRASTWTWHVCVSAGKHSLLETVSAGVCWETPTMSDSAHPMSTNMLLPHTIIDNLLFTCIQVLTLPLPYVLALWNILGLAYPFCYMTSLQINGRASLKHWHVGTRPAHRGRIDISASKSTAWLSETPPLTQSFQLQYSWHGPNRVSFCPHLNQTSLNPFPN